MRLSRKRQGVLDGDGARAGVGVVHLGIDEDLSALVAYVGIVHENAATSHLVFLEGIGDGNLVLGNEPHVTIDAAMIGEVERHLLFAGRVGLVVAVVGADGDDEIVAHRTSRERGTIG